MVKGLKFKIILLLFTSILFLIYGCSKKVEISPDSNEVNCLYYFIARTEQGGDSEINVFQRFDLDTNTIYYYYLKWRYISGANTYDREHLIILNTSSLKSELYPLVVLEDYPVIQKNWNNLKERNVYTDYPKERINELMQTAKPIRANFK